MFVVIGCVSDLACIERSCLFLFVCVSCLFVGVDGQFFSVVAQVWLWVLLFCVVFSESECVICVGVLILCYLSWSCFVWLCVFVCASSLVPQEGVSMLWIYQQTQLITIFSFIHKFVVTFTYHLLLFLSSSNLLQIINSDNTRFTTSLRKWATSQHNYSQTQSQQVAKANKLHAHTHETPQKPITRTRGLCMKSVCFPITEGDHSRDFFLRFL